MVSVGVWMVPVVLAGLAALLWAAAWYEGVVAPLDHQAKLPRLDAVDTALADRGAGPEFLGMDGRLDAELDRPAI